jgi:uncharacterized membrane protein YqhA
MTEGSERSDLFERRRERLANDPRFQKAHRWEPAIGASRFIILLAIFGTSLSALSMLVFGVIVVMKTIWHTFRDANFDVEHAKHLAVELIEMTDLFLFGMVLYVVGFGMYQLFIDAEVSVPAWMRVESLADLKTQLINVIVVLLAVSFLATAVSWTSDRSILYFGISIAVVIIALAAYNLAHHRIVHDEPEPDQ